MQLEVYLWENAEPEAEPVVRWADGMNQALVGFALPRDHVTVLGRRHEVSQLISTLQRALDRAKEVEARHLSGNRTS
jgi:hypothetical protein